MGRPDGIFLWDRRNSLRRGHDRVGRIQELIPRRAISLDFSRISIDCLMMEGLAFPLQPSECARTRAYLQPPLADELAYALGECCIARQRVLIDFDAPRTD